MCSDRIVHFEQQMQFINPVRSSELAINRTFVDDTMFFGNSSIKWLFDSIKLTLLLEHVPGVHLGRPVLRRLITFRTLKNSRSRLFCLAIKMHHFQKQKALQEAEIKKFRTEADCRNDQQLVI